jgi:hypothetical protein
VTYKVNILQSASEVALYQFANSTNGLTRLLKHSVYSCGGPEKNRGSPGRPFVVLSLRFLPMQGRRSDG